jgi:hypothetical protein
MAIRKDVFDFLSPIDPRLSFLAVGEMLIQASSDKELRKAISEAAASVFGWISNEKKPPIRSETLAKYNRIRRRDRPGYLPSVPEALQPLLTVLYLRAKAALRNTGSGMRSFTEALRVNLPKVKTSLAKLDEDFLGALLLETEVRALHDHAFARLLDDGAQELAAAVPPLQSVADQLVTLKPAKRPDEECECIVSACNALGDCQLFCIGSWWICFLIFIAIIIIIVAG